MSKFSFMKNIQFLMGKYVWINLCVEFRSTVYWINNGEPAVLVHHGIVRRWRCGSLFTQRPLSLLLSTMYQLLLSMTLHCYCLWHINFKVCRGKNWQHGSMGNKTDKPSIAIYQISGLPLLLNEYAWLTNLQCSDLKILIIEFFYKSSCWVVGLWGQCSEEKIVAFTHHYL